MNRALKRISLAILVMFLLLLINTNYLQAFDATSLALKPQNGRALSESNQYERGNITTSDQVNTILAAGRADLVALGRPHLVDPSFTMRAAAWYGADGTFCPPQ